MTGEGREGLPEGWVETTLGDVVDYGRTEKAEPHEIPADAWVLELEDIEKDSSKIVQRATFQERDSRSTKNRFLAGDVLYGKLRPYLNKVVLADGDGYCTTEIIPIKAGANLDGRFVFYWLKHPEFLRYVSTVSHGMNMPRLGTDAGREAPFILAPLPEQIRIADKLDALLTRVEAGRERLERVPKLVKQLRQAVLSAAVSGELTREWRGGGDAEWEEKPLNQVALSRLGKMLDQSKNTGTLTPYLRNVNVRWFGFQLDDVASLRVEDAERTALSVKRGDVLICEGGEPGRCAVWNGEDGQFVYQKALHRVRVGSELNADWLTFCLKHAADSGRLEDYFTGTTIKHFTGASLAQFLLPLPPLPEQAEIVRRVEALFALADRLEQRYAAALAAFERLTPALFAKAFRGELVPQDPADEPASVLLERIRAQRAAEGQKPKRGRKPGKAAGEDGAEPKRRGRPPKAQAEGAGEVAEPKRRGRPPKARTIPTALNEQEAVRLLQERGQARAEGSRQVGLFED
ncbi:hypothetical protein Dcar01_03704 [Deinococcus carri]|uniref:Type I restriction modification DNA specificity domain-containing protein n=1 Tax=Deinococcus carri TaxID=1211323 RepID=A0ABP9WEN4_9DEIO